MVRASIDELSPARGSRRLAMSRAAIKMTLCIAISLVQRIAILPSVWQSVIAAGLPEGKARLSSQREDMAKTTFRLPKSLLKEVQHFAIEHDKTDTQVFNEALKAWLVEQKKLRKQSKKTGPERSK
jgi:hypothetical protein